MPRAKKTVKRVAKTAKVVTPEVSFATIPEISPTPMKKMNSKFLASALVVIGLALLAYKLGPWLIPAVVDKRPITRFEVWNRMDKSYGTQTIDDLVNEKVLEEAIENSGVKVEQAKVDTQMKALEDQFSALGGLDEALKQRGLTRKDLEKQVRTQVAVEEILADKIAPTDAEVKAQFDAGAATTYKDKKFDDVKASIADEIKQAKMRDEFLTWFADVKKDIKVKTFAL